MAYANPAGRPTSHGSAQLVGPRQAGLVRMGRGVTAFPLGVAPGVFGREVGLQSWPAGQNLLILGPSRSGKGVNFFVPGLLSAVDQPTRPTFVVSDPKGELLALSRTRLEAAGYSVHVVALSDPGLSDPWNPLAWLDTGSGEPDYAEAQALAQALVPASPQAKDPFWDSAARLIAAASAVLAYRLAPHALKRPGNLADMLALAYTVVSDPSGMAAVAGQHDAWAAEQLRILAGSLENDPKLAASISVDIPVRYQSWTQPSMLSILAQPATWTWADVLDDSSQPHAVFVMASSTQSAQQVVLWSSLMAAGIRLQRERGRFVRPTWLLLDEAANIGPVSSLLTALTVLPGAGVSTVLGLQSTQQVETVYDPAQAKTILASLHGYVVLSGADHDSAQWVSDRLGVGTVRTQVRQTDRHGSVSWYAESHQRRVLTPDEVAGLRPSQILVQRLGFGGTKLRARPYYTVRTWSAEAAAGNPSSPLIAERLAAMRHEVLAPPTLQGLAEALLAAYMAPPPEDGQPVSAAEVEDITAQLKDLLK